MKLYTFLDSAGNIIEQIKAENHLDAVNNANSWQGNKTTIDTNTDFYSENIE